MGQIKNIKLHIVTDIKSAKTTTTTTTTAMSSTPVLRGFLHRGIRRWMWESLAVGLVSGVAYFAYGPYPVEKAYENFYATYETPKGVMYEWLEKEPIVPKGFVLPDSIKEKYQEHVEE